MISRVQSDAGTSRDQRGGEESRRFVFERDTFSFANELVWEYRVDPTTGQTTTFKRTPPPSYAHRCFVLVRSARQFFNHASFNPAQPMASLDTYRKLIREVVSRNPRTVSVERLVIPGYESLREFSKAQEYLLKAECGGAWQSYFLRSHWRMVYPFSRKQQRGVAEELASCIDGSPIVHVVRFPQLTINHGLLLFGGGADNDGFRFIAYDPNNPKRPSELTYSNTQRCFLFPRNNYWAGGPLDAFHIYRNWLY